MPHRTQLPHKNTLDFSDKSVRLAFIRKVYSILMGQLLLTALIITLFIMNETVAEYFHSRPWWLLIAIAIIGICLIVMSCFGEARRKPPLNYVLLIIFTVGEGFLLGVISSTYKVNEVLLAVGICVIVCFALTIFAFQSAIDFTVLGGFLFVTLVIFTIFGVLLIFFPYSNILSLIYSCFGALLFSFYLIYHTQLIIGGDHQYAISPDEYIFAALTLYLDIINIFVFLLAIVGVGSRGSRNQS